MKEQGVGKGGGFSLLGVGEITAPLSHMITLRTHQGRCGAVLQLILELHSAKGGGGSHIVLG